MLCPRCKSGTTQVIDSRDSVDGIRRRRECTGCKHRFTTYERCEPITLLVQKKNGTRERFSADKIRKGITISCKNRPVSEDAIETLVEQLEQTLSFSGQEVVTSREIGKLVEAALKQLDEIAYVRFVSVCESFDNVTQFTKTIKSLS